MDGSPIALLAALACLAVSSLARAAPPDAAAALRARYPALEKEFAQNAFGRPLHLDSQETQDWLAGDVHAVVEHPFAQVRSALGAPDHWCDVLILHLNIKYCRSTGQAPENRLLVQIGSKHAQSLVSAQRVMFDLHVKESGPDYLRVELHAPEGALGTRDYRITLEAVPLDTNRSFIHLVYTYRYGFAARMAMQGYLGTVASGKVGFSVTGRAANGQPVYVKGVRAVVERNTMRYYLAIDAYVATADLPPGQVDRRLREWFAATEQYALQLHELDESEYLAMKRQEIERQRGG
jgi:hypothetical protein